MVPLHPFGRKIPNDLPWVDLTRGLYVQFLDTPKKRAMDRHIWGMVIAPIGQDYTPAVKTGARAQTVSFVRIIIGPGVIDGYQ